MIIVVLFCGCTQNAMIPEIKESSTSISRENKDIVKSVWFTYYELSAMIKGKSEADFASEIDEAFKKVNEMGFNTVTVQVRAFADAFYISSYFPTSDYIVEKQGEDISFDPLTVMCETAKKYKLKIEAWINPYRVSHSNNIKSLSNNNVAKKWINTKNKKSNIYICDSGIFFNPASSEVTKLIVKGVKEGRLTYSNIRKVTFFLISTAFAEIGIFILSMLFGLPLPFSALQLLWINLITEGIQGIAIAMEKAEGNEMRIPPRDPKEPIFNQIMLTRIIITSIVMILGCFFVYKHFFNVTQDLIMARSTTLFLMILFQNMQVFNSRSETQSLFRQGFFKNPFLFISIIVVTLIHIVASYVPAFDLFLKIDPLSWNELKIVLPIACLIIVVMEFEKLIRKTITKYNIFKK